MSKRVEQRQATDWSAHRGHTRYPFSFEAMPYAAEVGPVSKNWTHVHCAACHFPQSTITQRTAILSIYPDGCMSAQKVERRENCLETIRELYKAWYTHAVPRAWTLFFQSPPLLS